VEIVVPRVPGTPHRVGPHGWWCGGGGVPRAGEAPRRFRLPNSAYATAIAGTQLAPALGRAGRSWQGVARL